MLFVKTVFDSPNIFVRTIPSKCSCIAIWAETVVGLSLSTGVRSTG